MKTIYSINNCHAWRVAEVLYSAYDYKYAEFDATGDALLLGLGIGRDYYYPEYYRNGNGYVPLSEILAFMRIIRKHPEAWKFARETLQKNRFYGEPYNPEKTISFVEWYKKQKENERELEEIFKGIEA